MHKQAQPITEIFTERCELKAEKTPLLETLQ